MIRGFINLNRKNMALRNKIKYNDLLRFITRHMDDWGEIINASPRQVRECFKEITEFLLDEGCRFKIERTYGKHDWMCC